MKISKIKLVAPPGYLQFTEVEASEYGNVDFSSAKEDKNYTKNWFFFKCLFEYINNGTIILPTTGSIGIWKYTIAGTGLTAAIASCIIIINSKKKKKKHKQNKKK